MKQLQSIKIEISVLRLYCVLVLFLLQSIVFKIKGPVTRILQF